MIHPNILPASTSSYPATMGQEVAPHPPRAEYLATLSKHTAAVNVVRFSPSGQMLASAGDGEWSDLNAEEPRTLADFRSFRRKRHPMGPI